MEAFDKSFVYCKNDDLEYGNNVCYVIVFLFFIIFLFLGSFRDIALARFSFSKSDRENRKRDIFISETVIRGKLARRDKLGSCFKCRETRNEEEMSEGKCTSGIQ